MISRKVIFTDTVTLFNYIGEIGGRAAYSKAILRNVKFQKHIGRSAGGTGNVPDNSATLYFFDRISSAEDENGTIKTYLPPSLFSSTNEPYSYFTFRSGKDFVVNGECTDESPKSSDAYRITLASRFDAGTKRIHHWRCDCK